MPKFNFRVSDDKRIVFDKNEPFFQELSVAVDKVNDVRIVGGKRVLASKKTTHGVTEYTHSMFEKP